MPRRWRRPGPPATGHRRRRRRRTRHPLSCPLTGQPDFAHLVIDYIPQDWLVESKSLKLYLSSFRNHGAFHEACTVTIALRLVETLSPAWLRIGGYWWPRGPNSPIQPPKRNSGMPASAEVGTPG